MSGAAAIGLEICYPLTRGQTRTVVTVAAVVAFFAASVSHAWFRRGAGWALGLVAVTAGGGLAAESLGLHTGVPFGGYAYADTLGWKLFGVPVVVPLAWTMMAYPSLLAARRLSRSHAHVPLVGGVALAAWDLFLDPQMVAAGHWTWSDPDPALPGIPGVPLTNFIGWLLVAVVMMTLLHATLPQRPADDRLPALLYLWTYASSVLAHAVFFNRPAVAAAGAAGMGLVAVPYALVLWRDRP